MRLKCFSLCVLRRAFCQTGTSCAPQHPVTAAIWGEIIMTHVALALPVTATLQFFAFQPVAPQKKKKPFPCTREQSPLKPQRIRMLISLSSRIFLSYFFCKYICTNVYKNDFMHINIRVRQKRMYIQVKFLNRWINHYILAFFQQQFGGKSFCTATP